ncbi:unnamed protein product [Adineta ricciae]|uniref:Uncharacterized protein n=1 Tax=Adineta ricciae TaxID=249248 RepID=A0A814BDK7_ADIRI|nr:unnamed protein product [Adineta ricciae]CAF0958844.1 unnamed protein product [Adineta ricciae]
MATPTRPCRATTDVSKTIKHSGQVLIWLDDSAEEEIEIKGVFMSLFDNVFVFSNPDACLELIKSVDTDTPCLSILISGKYGQMLVHDRLQPLIQVKYIYVFCFDTVKHSRWAQTCDKVRCVFSDITKVVQCIQFDMQNASKQHQQNDQPPLPEVHEPILYKRERFIDDYNLFDHVGLNLLLESSNDGIEDFTQYCEAIEELDFTTDDRNDHPETLQLYFDSKKTLQEWYRPNLSFLDINSNDLLKLWTLRWFVRGFYRKLTMEKEKFSKDQVKFTTYHATYLAVDELDAMKHRIGQIIIITEPLLTYTDRQVTLNSAQAVEPDKYKVVFEINIDSTIHETIPYGQIKDGEILLWFGGRYRLYKIEYVDDQDPYWLLSLNLCPTLDIKPTIQTLYGYYLKELCDLNDLPYAFGRLLMYKGSYIQAEKWLQASDHYEELAELALRQSHYEQAKDYLDHLPNDCHRANLLRVYFYLLTMNDDYTKMRLILLRILSEATDKLVRARVNITLGFIHLIVTQQFEQAFEHFTIGNDVMQTLLPPIHPDVAKSYLGIAYTYYSQGNFIDAKKNFQTAFNIQKQSLIYTHPDLAKTRSGLAHCLSTDKQTMKNALNEFEYALNILLEAYQSEHHPEIVATRLNMEQLRKGKQLLSRNTLLDYI